MLAAPAHRYELHLRARQFSERAASAAFAGVAIARAHLVRLLHANHRVVAAHKPWDLKRGTRHPQTLAGGVRRV